MNKHLLATLFLLLASFAVKAQNDGVQIDYSVTPPARNASAIFQLNSTNQGILIPRLTYAQEQAIVSPASGLMVFNTTSQCLDVYTGGAWQSIYCGCPNLDVLQAISGNTPVCAGTNQTYSVPGISGASSYTWTVTGSPTITGNGSSIISFNAPSLSTYTVSVTATNGCGTSSVSQSRVVNCYTSVPNQPVWNPTPVDVCTGSSFNYTITPAYGVNGTGVIDYTWTITTTGSATATLTANSQTASAGSPVTYTAAATGITLNHGTGLGTVTVSVVGNNTCGSSVARTFTQNIVGQPTVGTSPTATQSVCTGAPITLTAGTVSGTGSYTYRWYFNTTNSQSGATAIAGATGTIASGVATTSYVLNTANGSGASPAGTGFAGTYYYFCDFTPLNNTNCGPVQSGFAQVIVVPQPTVTTQPTAVTTVCTGGGVTLTAGPSGTGSYTYQWFYNTANSNSGGTSIAGATGTIASGGTTNYILVNNNGTTASPAGTGVAGTFYYYCRFTPLGGTNCGPVSSGVGGVNVLAQPTFTTQPVTTQTVCTGASVNLSAVAGGTGNYTYQWYYNTINSNSGGTAISGATGTVAAASSSNYPLVTTNTTTASPAGTGVGGTFYYYCTFTPQGTSNCGPITSTVAIVIVNIRSTNPTSATVSVATICNGQSTALTLNGGGGGTGTVIRWYTGSCGGSLVGSGNGLSVSPTVTTTYYGRYEDPAPCSNNTLCSSVPVTVNQPSVAPTTLTATAATICTGSSSTLTQTGGSLGTGAVWRWYSNSGYTTLVGTGTGANASLVVSPTTTTTYWLRAENTTSPCIANIPGPVGGVTVTVDQTSVLGTPSTTGPIEFCDAGGNFGTAVTISGYTGTVNWQWGSSNGGWNAWVTGPSSGVNTFPKKVAVSDGNPDRMRWSVTNGVCPATAASAAILINNRYNEAPSSLASNQNNYCTGTVANLTLTATFPTATNILGTVQFYSGSCAGTLVATVAGNGTTSVATTITAPTSTTNYYVRYNPGTGTSCSPGACASTTVTVSQLSVLGTVSNAGPIDFCNASGDWSSVPISVSGNVGTVTWQYGWSSGGWSGNWVTGNSPGYCCFPKKVNTSDGNADRIRWFVQNGACPATAVSSPILLRNRYNEAPTSLTTSAANICAGSSVTLTANFPSDIDILGRVEFYSGSCGGTLVGFAPIGNNVTSVSINVTPPSGTTTTYYARYVPGVGTGCSNTTCASVSVTVAAGSYTPGSQTFNYTGGLQTFTVPACTYSVTIDARGAQGGCSWWYCGGYGARIIGTVAVTPGQQLRVMVGAMGQPQGYVGGGGGGSFVSTTGNSPLIVAGGGGGGNYGGYTCAQGYFHAVTGNSGQYGINGAVCQVSGSPGSGGNGGGADPYGYGNGGAGGGGFYGNGSDAVNYGYWCGFARGGASFVNGGAGGARADNGTGCGNGGYGGGGGSDWCYWTGAGGGGGYSGGGGGVYYGVGGGGGSYNGGTSQQNYGANWGGNGQVVISW
jgi:hypothetical protein